MYANSLAGRAGGWGWSEGVVRGSILALPEALRGPVLGLAGPERVGRSKTEGEEGGSAKIQAAGGYVALAQMRLMAAQSHVEPSRAVERAGGFQRAADDCRQSSADA